MTLGLVNGLIEDALTPVKSKLDGVKDDVYGTSSSTDLIESITSMTNGTSGGITYSLDNETKIISASGTRSGNSFRSIFTKPYQLPEGFEQGEKYIIDITSSSYYLCAYIVFKKNGSELSHITVHETQEFTVPMDAEGIELQIRTFDGWPQNGSGTITMPKMYKTVIENGLTYDVSQLQKIASDNQDKLYYMKGASKKLARTKKLCIIGAGQSNIDGRVPVASLPNYITLPMSGMKYIKNELNGSFTDSFPSVERYAFDLITCYNLINNLGSNQLYYIKWSLGETSIDPSGMGEYHWTADYEKLSSSTHSLLLKLNKEIEKCGALNPDEYEIGAMIWHQGEADHGGNSIKAASNYYDNLKKVIAFCRGIAGNECLPFICGTISRRSTQYDATVDAAFRKIAKEDPYMYVVDMANAVLLDNWHFNAAWSEYFGKKVYDCLIDAGVITGEKINPSEPT